MRQYLGDELVVRIRGLEQDGPVLIRIEHNSGAALIVPDCQPDQEGETTKLRIRGFDGTDFILSLDGPQQELEIEASTPSPILGGARTATLSRGPDVEPGKGELRQTGDEPTLPIPVKGD